ncbi:MAG: TldD/PmbA family protein [Desulfomonilaceae bacterium]|nr:TldD/PmbA family protein [Desulfomonilaceae bacterium]
MTTESIDVERVVTGLASSGCEFADLFLEERTGSTLVFEGGKVDRIRQGIDRGVGLRVIRDKRTLYAFSSEVSPRAVNDMADSLIGAGDSSATLQELSWMPREIRPLSVIGRDPGLVDLDHKIGLLRQADDAARSMGDEIVQVRCVFADERRRVIQANSEGVHFEFLRVGLIFMVHVTARRGDLLQTGYEPVGGQWGMELFDRTAPDEIASRAASRALMMLDAREAPSGRMPVILHSDAGGTMIHEAVGHGLEADFIKENMSVYARSLGKKVASKLVSVVDDPTIPNLRGSYPVDDEGTPARRTVLVEDGILKGFLFDRLNALRQDATSTGNGRRESYRHKPIPRMSNTMILPGAGSPEEILRDTPHGLLVKKMGGGQVNPVNGDFVFEVAEGYLIEDGRQGAPVRGATLVGNGPRVLSSIDMVGNDLGFAIGTCGKDGQGVPVSDAQPTLRIGTPDNPDTWITVGGTASSA